MANPNLDEDEPPLDPVLLRVQARLRRLMLFGGATLGIGIVAVLLAIFYRFFVMDPTGGDNDPPVGEPIVGEVTAEAVGLAPNAILSSVSIEGNVMLMVFRDGNDTVTVEVDRTTMRHLRTFRISGTAAAPAPPTVP
jgi:hypothetical protein